MSYLENYAHLFDIEKGSIALNHGSFGACPKAVTDYQFYLIKRMESLSTRFFMLELKPLLTESRERLAGFINVPVKDVLFVRNATTAANVVINSLPLIEGDEIVATDQIYESCRNLLDYTAQEKMITVHYPVIPFNPESDEQILQAIFSKVNERTKLIFVDHIISNTSMIMPLDKILKKAAEIGVEVFVDGAHAPGMIPLDITELEPDYYAGNCHKWLCAPKGAAFLYINPRKQSCIKPPLISNYYFKGETLAERLFNSFHWLGTMDYTSCIAVKKAIDHLGSQLEKGWSAIRERNHDLACEGKEILLQKLSLDQHTQEERTGSMITFRTATKAEKNLDTTLDLIYYDLLENHNIEVAFPVEPAGERLLRISAHLYNKPDDYFKLAVALKKYF